MFLFLVAPDFLLFSSFFVSNKQTMGRPLVMSAGWNLTVREQGKSIPEWRRWRRTTSAMVQSQTFGTIPGSSCWTPLCSASVVDMYLSYTKTSATQSACLLLRPPYSWTSGSSTSSRPNSQELVFISPPFRRSFCML